MTAFNIEKHYSRMPFYPTAHPAAFRPQGQALFTLGILYFPHATLQFPLLLCQGMDTRVFPFCNLYMQKIHPSQECPFHPQEESGAI